MNAQASLVSIRLVGLLFVCLILASRAAAQPIGEEDEDVVGTWDGKAQFIEQDNLFLENTLLDVTEQRGRRFFGAMMVDETEFDIAGTVSAAGVVNMVGDTDRGTAVLQMGIGTSGEGAAFMAGRAKFDGDDGARLEGTQILLRQFDFDPQTDRTPPSVVGGWEGTFVSALEGEGEIVGTFERGTRAGSTRFVGELSFIEQDNLLQFEALEGSVNGEGDVVMIAMGVETPTDGAEPEYGVVIIVEGGYLPPPPPRDDATPPEPARIQGTYRVHSLARGRHFTPGDDNVIDFGTFEIIAILIGL
jgi:hypothetical protein